MLWNTTAFRSILRHMESILEVPKQRETFKTPINFLQMSLLILQKILCTCEYSTASLCIHFICSNIWAPLPGNVQIREAYYVHSSGPKLCYIQVYLNVYSPAQMLDIIYQFTPHLSTKILLKASPKCNYDVMKGGRWRKERKRMVHREKKS